MALAVKNLPDSAGDLRDAGSIPGSGTFPWRRKGQPSPVLLPGDPMDGGVWRATVHGVANSRTHWVT